MKALALACALAACGGGSGGGGGGGGPDPVTQAEAEEICRIPCEHANDCAGPVDIEACAAQCAATFVGWALADAVRMLFECQAMTPCGEPEDEACFGAVDTLPIHQQWKTECSAAIVDCSPTEIDDVCDVDTNSFKFLAPVIIEELLACLDEPACEDRLPCVDDVIAAHDVQF